MIKDIKTIISLTPAPYPGLHYSLVEFIGYYTIRLYRSNFDELPESHRLAFSEWISKIIRDVRSANIEFFLEVFDHEPGVHSK